MHYFLSYFIAGALIVGGLLLEATPQLQFDAATIADLPQADARCDSFCCDGAGAFPVSQQLIAWEIVMRAQANGRSSFLFACPTVPAVVVKPLPLLPVSTPVS